MAEFEFSFIFDEGNYENDFSRDFYEFENMWQDVADELRLQEENDQFQDMFRQKLHISSVCDCHNNERHI